MVDANATVPGGAEASYMFAIWNLVIRPPRTTYGTAQLGPPEFEIGTGIRGHRRDIRLRTKRGFHLQCSHFIPRLDKIKGKRREWQRTPVVIYLHGNASSRLEAAGLVEKLLERKISLFCFDWAGCGISEGDYISLGWHERDDLATVIEHLRESQSNGPIGIWGRSMGAVSALMHADRDPTLAGICLDSPFSSLRELIEEIAQSDRLLIPVPTWLVNGILSVIRMRVKALADFDIEDLVPLNHGPKSSVPALFMHGLQDNFVLPRHSEKLYNNYAGDKEIMMFDGDHNNERCEKVINRGVGFLCRAFRKHELEFSVSQHLADVHSDLHTQVGDQCIPHLPRASSRREALGDISNVAQQGPGARANEVEAVMKNSLFVRAPLDQVAEDSIFGAPVSPTSAQSNKRPAPRKFASSLGSHRPASPNRKAQELYGFSSQDLPLTTKGYPTAGKTSGQQILTPREGRTSRGRSKTLRGQENGRSGSKGPAQRTGSSLKAMVNALASRGGA